jgi:hypothetical protein
MVMEFAKAMMSGIFALQMIWVKAVSTAIYLCNFMSIRVIAERYSHEA